MKCVFSPCRNYRYTLWREFSTEFLFEGGNKMKDGYVMFIGLNPSTADDNQDDPTIRRCIEFTKTWGYGRLLMTNIFAWRDTLPKNMKKAAEPVGADNDYWLKFTAAGASVVVAAWGANGTHLNRGQQVKAMLPNLHCLRTTKEGHPEHPLYLPKTLKPIPFT